MTADVSLLGQVMNAGGYKKDGMNESLSGVGGGGRGGGGETSVLITRDLLGGGGGGCCSLDSKALDLDLQVPSGWEKRLDLKSGKVYLQRCNSSNASSPSSSSSQKKQQNHQQTLPKLQDLNFPPTLRKPLLNLFDDASLELKLLPSSSSSAASASSSSPSSSNYQSVCTLDKVKFALERAERQTTKKRSSSLSKSSSPISNSSSSTKETEIADYEEKSVASFAAGCPSCLLYVLISKNNPKCPRCNTIVPSPESFKKPRIDLNISI